MEQPNPFDPSPEAAEQDQSPEINFTPVPRLRQRRNGWTEMRQRVFIASLAACGSVARAARSVGMTARSAYRLAEADGAESFAAAWDQAIELGIARVRSDALDRALHGAPVALFRRGQLVRVEQRRNDRLAIALLGGRDREVTLHRRTAVARHEYYRELHAYDAARAEAARTARRVEDEHRALQERIDAEAADRKARRLPAVLPRVRQL